MSGINKVIILGNICKDIEAKYMPGGDAVANVCVITDEKWVDKNTGEKQERVEFHNLVFYRKLAEVVTKFLGKGDKIYIEGKNKTRCWEDEQGKKRYATDIVVDKLEMCGGKKDSDNSAGASKPYPKSKEVINLFDTDFDDDIPF